MALLTVLQVFLVTVGWIAMGWGLLQDSGTERLIRTVSDEGDRGVARMMRVAAVVLWPIRRLAVMVVLSATKRFDKLDCI